MGLFDADAVILDEGMADALLNDNPLNTDNGKPEDNENGGEEEKGNKPKPNADVPVDSSTLFGGGNKGKEKVGEDNEKDTKEEPESAKGGSANTFSLIATSMREEGILPDEIDVDKINDADTLREAFNKAVALKQDALTQRVNRAIEAKVEPDAIRNFENEIRTIDSVYTNEQLSQESKQAEQLRRNIMMADYEAQGFSKEKAQRFVDQSFKMGTDIDDAKEAAVSYRKTIQAKYDDAINDGERKVQEARDKAVKDAAEQKSQILEKDKVFDDFAIPTATRQKVYDNMTKQVAKDSDGNACTAIEKYFEDHPNEANRYVSMFYTLTNGFTDFSGLSKSISKKERKNAFAALEQNIQGTSRLPDGSLDFSAGTDGDSAFSGDWQPYLG